MCVSHAAGCRQLLSKSTRGFNGVDNSVDRDFSVINVAYGCIMPASAWNALRFWLADAVRFADQVLAVPFVSESQLFWWENRHPPFAPILYAFLGCAASNMPNSAQIVAVGVLSLAISVITLAYSKVRFLHEENNALIPILTLYAILYSPLYNKPLILYGYGEAWLSIWLPALVFSFSEILRGRISEVNALLTVVSFIFCASVKSTRFYYAAVVCCSYLCLLSVTTVSSQYLFLEFFARFERCCLSKFGIAFPFD